MSTAGNRIRRAATFLLVSAVGLGSWASAGRGEPSFSGLSAIYSPDYADAVTLSPDGARLAYVRRNREAIAVVIRELDLPRQETVVFADVDLTRGVFTRSTLVPARVTFLSWVDSARLVFATSVPEKSRRLREELHVYDVLQHTNRMLLGTDDVEGSFEIPKASPPFGDGEIEYQTVAVRRALNVVGFLRAGPPAVLVQALGTERVATRILRVAIDSGERTLVAEEGGEDRLQYDADGHVRLRETRRILAEPITERQPGMHLPAIPPAAPVAVRQYFDYRPRDGRGWRRLDDLAGREFRFSRDDTDTFRPRSVPLGFAADPNVLYFASNVGRDTYGIYAMDMATGKRRPEFSVEAAGFDLADPSAPFSMASLVLDRQHMLLGVRIPGTAPTTRWFDPGMQQHQSVLEQRFAGREVRILAWSDARNRILFEVRSGTDPGRTYLWDGTTAPAVTELLRRNPAIAAEQEARVVPLMITRPDGSSIHGVLTLARNPRISPPPLVVLCRDLPGSVPVYHGYDRDAQALAAFGFMVLEVDHGGTLGRGKAHADAIHAALDRVPLDDLESAVHWVARRYPFDSRRVAWIGEGFGGYLVLRELERAPAGIRSAIIINAPTDLRAWSDAEQVTASRGASPFARSVPSIALARRHAFFAPAFDGNHGSVPSAGIHLPTTPVMIVAGSSPVDVAAQQDEKLRAALQHAGAKVEFVRLGAGERPLTGDVAARLAREMGRFLNETLFDYRVQIGSEKEVK